MLMEIFYSLESKNIYVFHFHFLFLKITVCTTKQVSNITYIGMNLLLGCHGFIVVHL